MVLLYCKKAKLGNSVFSFILQVELYSWDHLHPIIIFTICSISSQGCANNVVVAETLEKAFSPIRGIPGFML